MRSSKSTSSLLVALLVLLLGCERHPRDRQMGSQSPHSLNRQAKFPDRDFHHRQGGHPQFRPEFSESRDDQCFSYGSSHEPARRKQVGFPNRPSPIFKELDRDKDSELSSEEVDGAVLVLGIADRNKDGVVTLEEWRRQWGLNNRETLAHRPGPENHTMPSPHRSGPGYQHRRQVPALNPPPEFH